jgi:hypothetical protein
VDITLQAIDGRNAPYNDRTACRQCPENCRITFINQTDGTRVDYEGDCGLTRSNVADGTPFAYNDCSTESCPADCRSFMKLPEKDTTCDLPSRLSTKPCVGCSALCRRSDTTFGNDDLSTYCDSDYCGELGAGGTNYGCSEECKLPDPPRAICDSCLECPSDCLSYPATRTDCAEVCTDEALAGPLNIGPSDFIKKLPGATGSADVKNVGTLMVPALVLPLFCMVIVIAFIRIFSPILGGDIEIPGLGRII